jgi:hypothetical protein
MGLIFGWVAVYAQVRVCFGIPNRERTFNRRIFCGLSLLGSAFYAAKPSPPPNANPSPNLCKL